MPAANMIACIYIFNFVAFAKIITIVEIQYYYNFEPYRTGYGFSEFEGAMLTKPDNRLIFCTFSILLKEVF